MVYKVRLWFIFVPTNDQLFPLCRCHFFSRQQIFLSPSSREHVPVARAHCPQFVVAERALFTGEQVCCAGRSGHCLVQQDRPSWAASCGRQACGRGPPRSPLSVMPSTICTAAGILGAPLDLLRTAVVWPDLSIGPSAHNCGFAGSAHRIFCAAGLSSGCALIQSDLC
jgi:hypothetical protein